MFRMFNLLKGSLNSCRIRLNYTEECIVQRWGLYTRCFRNIQIILGNIPRKAGIYWFYLNLLVEDGRAKGSIDVFVRPIQQLRPFCHCRLFGLDLQLLPLLGAQVQELGLRTE